MEKRKTIYVSKTEYRIRKGLMLFTYYGIRVIGLVAVLAVIGFINIVASKVLHFIPLF